MKALILFLILCLLGFSAFPGSAEEAATAQESETEESGFETTEADQLKTEETATVEDEEGEVLDLDEKPLEEAKEETSAAEPQSTETAEAGPDDVSGEDDATESTQEAAQAVTQSDNESTESVAQTGPFVDLLGPKLLSLEMINSTAAQIGEVLTNDVLKDKSVVGLYFSADWCGPCRQFTPELVAFYEKMNARRANKDDFEIVWVSRCRDLESFGQYFTHMKWYALPPSLAMGEYGEHLSRRYGVQGIPTLILLEGDSATVITKDARNKIPQDKAGIGFPWRNPLITAYRTILPKTVRYMIKAQLLSLRQSILSKLKSIVGIKANPNRL